MFAVSTCMPKLTFYKATNVKHDHSMFAVYYLQKGSRYFHVFSPSPVFNLVLQLEEYSFFLEQTPEKFIGPGGKVTANADQLKLLDAICHAIQQDTKYRF